jgi:hypothetical protein
VEVPEALAQELPAASLAEGSREIAVT